MTACMPGTGLMEAPYDTAWFREGHSSASAPSPSSRDPQVLTDAWPVLEQGMRAISLLLLSGEGLPEPVLHVRHVIRAPKAELTAGCLMAG